MTSQNHDQGQNLNLNANKKTNSKRAVLAAALIAIISLSSVVIVVSMQYFAVGPFSPAWHTDQEYEQRAQQLFQEVFSFVEKTRNVTLPQTQLIIVTREWSKETWGKGYADPDRANILRDENTYKSLFMIAQDRSLYQAKVDWAGGFVAAKWGDKIYVVKENFNPWNTQDAKATLVHELTHLLQDQYKLPETKRTFDSDKARGALAEGDASFMAEYFKSHSQIQASAITVNALSDKPSFADFQFDSLFASVPDSLSRLDYFPYTEGKQYIAELHAKNGWEAINQAFANAPNTTEQTLHLDKYFAREPALQVTQPNITESGWTQTRNDRFGEFFIQTMLLNWIPKEQAETAAAGWGGDNFTYYDGANQNEYLFTWNITWDTKTDAEEFFSAFQKMMSAPDVGTTKPNQDVNMWTANGRYLSLTLKNYTTVIACSTNQTSITNMFPG